MTLHSITNQRPFDILYNKIEHDTIPQILQQAQEKILNSHNKGRKKKDYLAGEVIYEKKHVERNKLNSIYKKQVVKENLHNKVYKNQIKSNRDEDVINDFERILTMPQPQPAMASSSQASNQVSDLITHIVNNELNPLRNEIVSLKAQLNQNIK